MDILLNKNMFTTAFFALIFLFFLNCNDLKQGETEINIQDKLSPLGKSALSGKGALSVSELAGTWRIQGVEKSNDLIELSFIPADTSYICPEAPCFLVQEITGKFSKKGQQLLGMTVVKKDDRFAFTFFFQTGWGLREESFQILGYSPNNIAIGGDFEKEVLATMTRISALQPSIEPLPKIFPSCPVKLDMSPPNPTKSQERKCTYRIFLHLQKNGIKRGLNDLIMGGTICAPEYMDAAIRLASTKKDDKTDKSSVEELLTTQFDTMPWLDLLTPEYHKNWAKEVSCCQSGDC